MKAGISMADRGFECVLCGRTFSRFTPDALLLSENLVCDDCLKEFLLLDEGELVHKVTERLSRNPARDTPELEQAVTRFILQNGKAQRGG